MIYIPHNYFHNWQFLIFHLQPPISNAAEHHFMFVLFPLGNICVFYPFLMYCWSLIQLVITCLLPFTFFTHLPHPLQSNNSVCSCSVLSVWFVF